MNFNHLSELKDNQLLENFSLVVNQEREAISVVVSHLAEIDKRRLYAEQGYSSMFEYLVQKYHYSEGAAYRRIQVARLSLKFPEIIDRLKKGEFTLMTLSLIAPHLREENKEELFSHAIHQSTREVESFLSLHLGKREILKDKIRRLPMLNIEMPPKGSSQRESGQVFSQSRSLEEGTQKETAQNFTLSAESKSENLSAEKKMPDLDISKNIEPDITAQKKIAPSAFLGIPMVKIEFCTINFQRGVLGVSRRLRTFNFFAEVIINGGLLKVLGKDMKESSQAIIPPKTTPRKKLGHHFIDTR
jgi:hypothetical protein